MNNLLFDNYIGPQSENIEYLKELISKVLDFQKEWRQSFYPGDPSLYTSSEGIEGGGQKAEVRGQRTEGRGRRNEKLEEELLLFLERSKSNLPYFHPRYVAQMVKDPSIPTVLGYLTFMLSNPNNHAYEGGPVTTEMEMEVTDLLLRFVGFESGWGHITSGGSLANMEALWAARDFYTNGSVCFSEVSHYSWKRICSILRIDKFSEIQVDSHLRMDLNVLEEKLKKEHVMFVMANLGSTGAGSIDDLESIIALKKKYNFHLHIDAAYGGFLRSVILDDNYNLLPYNTALNLSTYSYRQLSVMKHADSITIDPHKQGAISYGAGAVLYKDEGLRKIVLNTAPYTYHKTDKPNIGMFSLEGSRPGAMAAACYLTYKVMPPNASGIGSLISNSLAGSRRFYELIEQSAMLYNLLYPDLDINCIYAGSDAKSIEEVNNRTLAIYKRLSVESESPEFILSKFITSPEIAGRVLPGFDNTGKENLNALRFVFMKHWLSLNDFYYIKELVKALEAAASGQA